MRRRPANSSSSPHDSLDSVTDVPRGAVANADGFNSAVANADGFNKFAIVCFALRVCAALTCRSYGAPDEHWQLLEAAHGMIFGSGYATWEWWPEIGLRSLAPPAALASFAFAPLRAAALFIWGDAAARSLPLFLVWLAPRIVACVTSLIADVAVYALAREVWRGDESAARGAALAAAGNWPSLVFGARATGNSLSACLLVITLAAAQAALWGRGRGGSESYKIVMYAVVAGAFGCLAVIVHPTVAAALAGYSMAVFICDQPPRERLHVVASCAALSGVLVYVAERVADAKLRGGRGAIMATILSPPPALRFAWANAVDGLDALSGSHGALWYLLVGVPAVVGVWIPHTVLGCRRASVTTSAMAPAIAGLFLVLGLNFASHKELRYLAPLAPIVAVYSGRGGVAASAPALIAVNALASAYVLFIHQRGPVAAVEYVAYEGSRLLEAGAPNHAAVSLPRVRQRSWALQWQDLASELSSLSVHQLMPCHAAPGFATLHWPIEFRILDCSPGAVRGGGIAARARERALTAAVRAAKNASACQGADALPPISESHAWILNKTALLLAMYGASPTPPLACDLAPKEATNAAHATWAEAVTRAPLNSEAVSDALFSVPPVAFVRAFGSPACASALAAVAAPGSNLLTAFRSLPSHALLYNTDAVLVADWLNANGFRAAASFSMGHFIGDAHAIAEGRGHPTAVVVYQHRCWDDFVSRDRTPAAQG